MSEDENDNIDERIGLALSGGGFRATLYHCGALIRLNELGYLRKLDRIASVSGGSITAGRLAARWSNLQFDANNVAKNLSEEIVQPLKEFCRQTLDLRVIGLGLIPFTKSGTERLVDAYDDQLLDGMTLDQLPGKPDFIFQATNLQTGRALRFSRRRVADYLVGEIKDTSKFLVAQAVAASSAFPPVLSPLNIKLDIADWSDLPGTEFFGQAQYMRALNLTDGGVYDNLGLERIDRFGTILCSDAGKPFNYGTTFSALTPKQVLRALDVAMDQSRARRTSTLFKLQSFTKKKVAYWGIDMGATRDPAPDLFPRSATIVKDIANLRTRLNAFSEQEQGRLINWGYTGCDERIRSYITPEARPPDGLPFPQTPIS